MTLAYNRRRKRRHVDAPLARLIQDYLRAPLSRDDEWLVVYKSTYTSEKTHDAALQAMVRIREDLRMAETVHRSCERDAAWAQRWSAFVTHYGPVVLDTPDDAG